MPIFDGSVEGEILEDDGIDYSIYHAYQSPDEIECFDNTMLTMYRECPRKFYWSIIRGFEPRKKSAALSFGSAWHKFLEVYLKGETWQRALIPAMQTFQDGNPPDDKTRNLSTLTVLAERYDQIFGASEYEVVDTELFGAIVIGDFLYGAKIDAVVFDNKRLKGVEHKTTSRMEARFFDMWRMAMQTRGYGRTRQISSLVVWTVGLASASASEEQQTASPDGGQYAGGVGQQTRSERVTRIFDCDHTEVER